MRGRRDGLDGEAEGKRFQLDADHYLNQIVNDHYGGRWTVVSGQWSLVSIRDGRADGQHSPVDGGRCDGGSVGTGH